MKLDYVRVTRMVMMSVDMGYIGHAVTNSLIGLGIGVCAGAFFGFLDPA